MQYYKVFIRTVENNRYFRWNNCIIEAFSELKNESTPIINILSFMSVLCLIRMKQVLH